MNGIKFRRIDRTLLIHRATKNIQYASENFPSNGCHDGISCVVYFHPAHHTFGRLHRDCAHAVFTEVLLDFNHHIDLDIVGTFIENTQRVVNRWQVFIVELHINNWSDYLYDRSYALCSKSGFSFVTSLF